KDLLLPGEIRDCETDIREECAGNDADALARHKFLSRTYGFARVRAVVTRDHFQLFAEDTALGVDFLNRHLPSLLVGIEKRGLRLVAVELADLDGLLRESLQRDAGGKRGGKCDCEEVARRSHGWGSLRGGRSRFLTRRRRCQCPVAAGETSLFVRK